MSPRHVTLVTGGSRGIGAAAARRLAADGDALVVCARGVAGCTALAEELRAAGGEAWAVAMDVADAGSVARAVGEARERTAGVGPIDRLVHAAGIAESAPLLAGGGIFERHLAVNLHGARHVTEALLPDMLERGAGHVVHVASSAGLRGYAYVAAYCASKHALVGYVRAAAAELFGKGVAIAALCPHYVDTPMTEASVARIVAKTGRSTDEAREVLAAQNPGGRLIESAEVAKEIAHLLAADSNGWIVEMDGAATGRVEPAPPPSSAGA